jgi:uncharacterized protein HemY
LRYSNRVFQFNIIIRIKTGFSHNSKPEKAVEVYEKALRHNPKDSVLAKKIGQALVKSHNYGKAISYYEAALKSGVQKLLRYDLAQLFFKLNQLDKAEKQVSQALNEDGRQNQRKKLGFSKTSKLPGNISHPLRLRLGNNGDDWQMPFPNV